MRANRACIPMPSLPSSFKGIALFTPGGDLVYCIDPSKQGQWHAHLCRALQEALNLDEPPYFLVPCYTATIDRWLDPETQQLHLFAELAPNIQRYRSLLNVLFELDHCPWKIAEMPTGICDPLLFYSYQTQYPDLWKSHNLAICLDAFGNPKSEDHLEDASGYVLRLFVAGHSMGIERTLEGLHRFLEESLTSPYTLIVVDIIKHPEEAETYQITATPTLMKVYPPPVRRLVGSLDVGDRLLNLLGLSPGYF
jgi:circadian clock protein KaiB